MKFETKSRENYLSFYLKFNIPFSKKGFQIRMDLFNKPSEWVHGYSSRTEIGKYVLFHDYDNLCFEDVFQELKFLQQEFSLSDYYVFTNGDNSFHAVCLDTFALSEAYNIQKQTSCDLAFIHSIKHLRMKEWVLRFGKKGERDAPKYIKTIKSNFDLRVKSNAHALFLKKIGVPVSFKGRFDGCQKIGAIKYTTACRIVRNGLNT